MVGLLRVVGAVLTTWALAPASRHFPRPPSPPGSGLRLWLAIIHGGHRSHLHQSLLWLHHACHTAGRRNRLSVGFRQRLLLPDRLAALGRRW